MPLPWLATLVGKFVHVLGEEEDVVALILCAFVYVLFRQPLQTLLPGSILFLDPPPRLILPLRLQNLLFSQPLLATPQLLLLQLNTYQLGV